MGMLKKQGFCNIAKIECFFCFLEQLLELDTFMDIFLVTNHYDLPYVVSFVELLILLQLCKDTHLIQSIIYKNCSIKHKNGDTVIKKNKEYFVNNYKVMFTRTMLLMKFQQSRFIEITVRIVIGSFAAIFRWLAWLI